MSKDEEPIPIEEEAQPLPLGQGPGGGAAQQSSKIQAFGSGAVRRGQVQFQRPLNLTGFGATRCRVFNCKVTVAALDHMVGQINEWLDANQVEIKYVNQVVGTLEGKTPEPNIIVTVWY